MEKSLDIQQNLVITNIFYWSLGPSLTRGYTVHVPFKQVYATANKLKLEFSQSF